MSSCKKASLAVGVQRLAAQGISCAASQERQHQKRRLSSIMGEESPLLLAQRGRSGGRVGRAVCKALSLEDAGLSPSPSSCSCQLLSFNSSQPREEPASHIPNPTSSPSRANPAGSCPCPPFLGHREGWHITITQQFSPCPPRSCCGITSLPQPAQRSHKKGEAAYKGSHHPVPAPLNSSYSLSVLCTCLLK